MVVRKIEGAFTVCKVSDLSGVELGAECCFVGKTNEGISVICQTKDAPGTSMDREDGWSAFSVEGGLDVSRTAVLAEISALLTEEQNEGLVFSAFDKEYMFVKQQFEMKILSRLSGKGYEISTGDAYGDYFINRSVTDIMSEYGEQEDEWT